MAQWTEPGLWGQTDPSLGPALGICRPCDPEQFTQSPCLSCPVCKMGLNILTCLLGSL